jgi:hypothetical protein
MRIIILLFLFIYVCAGAESQLITDKFTIDAPASSGDIQGPSTLFYIPNKNGYSGRVMVGAQEYSGTINDYIDLIRNQFKQNGMTFVSATITADSANYEAFGKLGNLTLHWYSRAIYSDGKIYGITAEGLEIDWKDQKDILIKSVDSFHMK